jgi:GNAT superfamily N-acetyltransferase
MSNIPNIASWDPLTAALVCEGSEANAYRSLAAASVFKSGIEFEAKLLAGGVILSCPSERSSTLLNRAICLGLNEELSEDVVAMLGSIYGAQNTPWSIELSPAATTPHVLSLLRSARLRRGLATAVLAINCSETSQPLSRFPIRRVGSEWGEQAANLEADTFRVSNTVRSLLTVVPSLESFRQWLAFDDDLPVAACVTHIHGDSAWFGWSVTAPNYQRQGIQSAMLAHCIADAHQLGCRWMTAETAVGTANEPDRSHKNMLRFGFSEVYRRYSYICMPRTQLEK